MLYEKLRKKRERGFGVISKLWRIVGAGATVVLYAVDAGDGDDVKRQGYRLGHGVHQLMDAAFEYILES